MNQVRIHGDPFGDDGAASLLRSFLRLALGSGLRCSLSLAAVVVREPAPDERVVVLTDGVRELRVGTRLPPAEIDLLLRAADEVTAATAPVLVFALPSFRADAVREAGLAWPRAAAMLPARDGSTAPDLLERVRAELRRAGIENPPHALDEHHVLPWSTLPKVAPGGVVVGVAEHELAGGVDLLIGAWRQRLREHGTKLRLVLPYATSATLANVTALVGDDAAAVEVLPVAFEPAHARDASAIALPWRVCTSTRVLVQALASGRPVCVSRFAATAPLLDRPGTCLPIGGRVVDDEPGRAAHFAPHPGALAHALGRALADPAAAVRMGRRARAFVVEELVRGRPTSPPPAPRPAGVRRPTVVLEAPLLETSSTAELTLATARALVRRGRVDVKLLPVAPFRHRLADLRARAPECEALLCRDGGNPDLWLSAGWPVRASRPECRTFALRVDQEYGTLPVELTPHVSQDADVVVVHSEPVFRTLLAAGRPMQATTLIPHGVDAAMHENVFPDPELVAWKGDRPAVLFCGGLIWRKGFDVFLQAVLAARAAGEDFCVVVKAVGADQHYGTFHLRGLLERFMATPGTPPVRLVTSELSRERLAAVYTACDVVLHPYRGEGFCLPVLEARACGLPVLATAGGATEPVMTGPGAERIPSGRRPVELPVPHVATPWVLEPSATDAGRLLVATLRDLPARRAAARSFAVAVRTAFSWDAAAAAIEDLTFAAAGKARVPAAAVEPLVALPQRAPRPAVPSPARA